MRILTVIREDRLRQNIATNQDVGWYRGPQSQRYDKPSWEHPVWIGLDCKPHCVRNAWGGAPANDPDGHVGDVERLQPQLGCLPGIDKRAICPVSIIAVSIAPCRGTIRTFLATMRGATSTPMRGRA